LKSNKEKECKEERIKRKGKNFRDQDGKKKGEFP
jgi:hypothetical protein